MKRLLAIALGLVLFAAALAGLGRLLGREEDRPRSPVGGSGVEGTVFGPDGMPAPEHRVHLSGVAGPHEGDVFAVRVASAWDGSYRVGGLPAGSYWLRDEDDGGATLVVALREQDVEADRFRRDRGTGELARARAALLRRAGGVSGAI
jgi:hypothetical protein